MGMPPTCQDLQHWRACPLTVKCGEAWAGGGGQQLGGKRTSSVAGCWGSSLGLSTLWLCDLGRDTNLSVPQCPDQSNVGVGGG